VLGQQAQQAQQGREGPLRVALQQLESEQKAKSGKAQQVSVWVCGLRCVCVGVCECVCVCVWGGGGL
jgi:hypothetical protein